MEGSCNRTVSFTYTEIVEKTLGTLCSVCQQSKAFLMATSSEESALWSSSQCNDCFCLHFLPLSLSAFLCCNSSVSYFICDHVHHCELVCDNRHRTRNVLSITVFCRRPEGCKKAPERGERNVKRSFSANVDCIFVHVLCRLSVPFSLIMFE